MAIIKNDMAIWQNMSSDNFDRMCVWQLTSLPAYIWSRSCSCHKLLGNLLLTVLCGWKFFVLQCMCLTMFVLHCIFLTMYVRRCICLKMLSYNVYVLQCLSCYVYVLQCLSCTEYFLQCMRGDVYILICMSYNVCLIMYVSLTCDSISTWSG